MTAPLSILTLALLGQADAFTLHFEGFVSTREMNQKQLTKMFAGAFEAVSDEPESLFAVSDSPTADVLASASQSLDEDGLVFHWSLSTTRCPIRHLELEQRRPRHALNFDETKVMVREVAHRAHELLHGHAGSAGLACLEEGESMGGTATAAAEDDGEPSGSGSYGGYGYGYGVVGFNARNGFVLRSGTAPGSTARSAGPASTPSFPHQTSVPSTGSHVMPGPAAIPVSQPAQPSGSPQGPKPTGASLGGSGTLTRGSSGGVGAATHGSKK